MRSTDQIDHPAATDTHHLDQQGAWPRSEGHPRDFRPLRHLPSDSLRISVEPYVELRVYCRLGRERVQDAHNIDYSAVEQSIDPTSYRGLRHVAARSELFV